MSNIEDIKALLQQQVDELRTIRAELVAMNEEQQKRERRAERTADAINRAASRGGRSLR